MEESLKKDILKYKRNGKEEFITIQKSNKSKNITLIFSSYCNKYNGNIRVILNDLEIKNFITLLEEYNELPIKKEEKAYFEEISTYSKGIERSLSLAGKIGELSLYLDCYTDKENDDNWISLTPKRLNTLINLLYGYSV